MYTITKYYERDYCRSSRDSHCVVVEVHLDNTGSTRDEDGGNSWDSWSVVTGTGERIRGDVTGRATAVAGRSTDFEVDFRVRPPVTVSRVEHGSLRLVLPQKTPEPLAVFFDSSGNDCRFFSPGDGFCWIEYASPSLTLGDVRAELNGAALPYIGPDTEPTRGSWCVQYRRECVSHGETATYLNRTGLAVRVSIPGVDYAHDPSAGTTIRFATVSGNETLWEHTW